MRRYSLLLSILLLAAQVLPSAGRQGAATGQLAPAYEMLSRAVADENEAPPALLLWAQTRLAEMAVRLQRKEDAERHYRVALAQGITDQFLLGSYADFLLERGRPRDVLQLLAGWERSDVLLLRLVEQDGILVL